MHEHPEDDSISDLTGKQTQQPMKEKDINNAFDIIALDRLEYM